MSFTDASVLYMALILRNDIQVNQRMGSSNFGKKHIYDIELCRLNFN